jgi:hypothetical protein
MGNLKKYSDFLISENNWLVRKVEKNKGSQSSQISLKTRDLFQKILQKIDSKDSSPIYIFNNVDLVESFYVIGELFQNSQEMGIPPDDSGYLITPGEKYSYCILNASKEELSPTEIVDGIYQIVSKNSSSGVKTIVEISNFSSLDESQKSEICSIIESRRIGGLILKNGEFFIITDNKNSKKGGRNLGKDIKKYFPKSSIEVYLHEFIEA